MYVDVSRPRSVSVLKETSVLLSVKPMKVMVRGLIRCVRVYMYVCICYVHLILLG